MKTIEQIYKEFFNRPSTWPHLGNLPIGVLFHGYKKELTENKELDDWVHVTDHGYPVSSHSIFNPGTDFFENQYSHARWMRQQHDHALQQKHISSLTTDDTEHIKKIVKGGIDFGHDSGSADITKHLVSMYGKDPYPTHFTRTPTQTAIRRVPETIDLTAIDSAIKKNRFDGEFHSFHGVGFDPDKVMGDSHILHLPAYTSGSVNRNIALKYAGFSPASGSHHVIHIIHPHNSTGVYIGNDDFMDNEVLLPRNMTLKMHAKHPTEYQVGSKNVKVWVASRQSHMET